MNKFFFNADVKPSSEYISVSGNTAHHIIRVLRMRPGEKAVFCDGACTDYFCALEPNGARGNNITFSVQSISFCDTELPYHVTLFQGIPSSEKLNFIVQKSVELGVGKIILVETLYSQKGNVNLERMNKISEMAAAQSKRGIIPKVEKLTQNSGYENNFPMLVAYENERTVTIGEAVKNIPPGNIGIWIGPEGGFAEEEIKKLQENGASAITLGKRILRTETAGIAAMAGLQYAWGASAL